MSNNEESYVLNNVPFARGSHVATKAHPDLMGIFALGRSNKKFWRLVLVDSLLSPTMHKMKMTFSIGNSQRGYVCKNYGEDVDGREIKWNFFFENDESPDAFLRLKQIDIEVENVDGTSTLEKIDVEEKFLVAIEFAENDAF